MRLPLLILLLATVLQCTAQSVNRDVERLQGKWRWVGSRYWAYNFEFAGSKMHFSDSGAPAWLPRIDFVDYKLVHRGKEDAIVITSLTPDTVRGMEFVYRFEGKRLILIANRQSRKNSTFTLERETSSVKVSAGTKATRMRAMKSL